MLPPPFDIDTARSIKDAWTTMEKPLMPIIMLGAFIGSGIYLATLVAYWVNGVPPPPEVF